MQFPQGRFIPSQSRYIAACTSAFMLSCLLSGCVEQLGDMRGGLSPAATAQVTRVSVGSLRGANVALSSIDGAPDAVASRFSQFFATSAGQQDISMTEAAKANYFVRGYLSAYRIEGGTAIGYVWDIFDAGRRRTQRVSDEIVLKSSTGEPWSLADDQVLASLADKSVNDLAGFLAGTPEVRAANAASTKPAIPVASAPAE